MAVPDHVVTLRYSGRKDAYTASYQEGRRHIRGEGESPEIAVEALLEELEGDMELNARMVLSVMFRGWLARLSREHGIPIEAPNLEVKKSKLITPEEYFTK